jgi:hypothetical protein
MVIKSFFFPAGASDFASSALPGRRQVHRVRRARPQLSYRLTGSFPGHHSAGAVIQILTYQSESTFRAHISGTPNRFHCVLMSSPSLELTLAIRPNARPALMFRDTGSPDPQVRMRVHFWHVELHWVLGPVAAHGYILNARQRRHLICYVARDRRTGGLILLHTVGL